MSFDNVNLFFAKDKESSNIVLITEVDKEDNKKYTCPICGSEVKPRLGKINSWHFYHVDKSKCNGEHMIHWWIKNKLIEKGTEFTIKADKEIKYVCKDIIVEQTYEINEKQYRPDLTVVTECGKTIYFEMEYSNKKRPEDYMSVWIDLNNIVVEVNTKDLITLAGTKLPTFKALFYDGKCREVKKTNTYHNTIGKYKERLIEEGKYDAYKETIKKLDWFWRDLVKYKRDEVNIEYMIELIDSIDGEERDVIEEILRKPRCIELFENYINSKVVLIKNMIKDMCKENNFDYNNFTIDLVKNSKKEWGRLYVKTSYKQYVSMAFEIYDATIFNIKSKLIYTFYKFNNLDFCREYFLPICNYIESKFEDVNISKGDYNDNYIYNIEIDNFPFNNKTIRIEIDIDNTCFYKNYSWYYRKSDFKKYEYDIGKANVENIQKFINLKLEERLQEFNEELQKEKQEILNGTEETNVKTHEKLNIIMSILNCNKDKIIKIKPHYFNNSNYLRGIYFEDYKNKNFFIYFKHRDIVKNSYIPYEDIIINDEYGLDVERINADIHYGDENYICFVETSNSYTINDNYMNLKYNIQSELQYKNINVSFKNVNNDYTYLPRYDFINATQQLKSIQKDIYDFTVEYRKNFDHCKIYNVDEFSSRAINLKINKILYPIIYINNKNINDELNLQLNINFTKNNENKFEPWVIKDFIQELNNIGINNINNII